MLSDEMLLDSYHKAIELNLERFHRAAIGRNP